MALSGKCRFSVPSVTPVACPPQCLGILWKVLSPMWIELTLFREKCSTAVTNGSAVGAPTLHRSHTSALEIEKLNGPLWGVGAAHPGPPFGPSHLAFRVPSARAGCPWRLKNFELRLDFSCSQSVSFRMRHRSRRLMLRFSSTGMVRADKLHPSPPAHNQLSS